MAPRQIGLRGETSGRLRALVVLILLVSSSHAPFLVSLAAQRDHPKGLQGEERDGLARWQKTSDERRLDESGVGGKQTWSVGVRRAEIAEVVRLRQSGRLRW